MHNEKNMGEAVWNTCLDIAEKSKNNVKARLDLALICNRPSMHLVQKSNGHWIGLEVHSPLQKMLSQPSCNGSKN
jgi:hypothetical protein